MSDLQNQLRAELETLRDNISIAMRDARPSDVQQGYEIYREVITAVVGEYLREPSLEFRWSAPEWQWLTRDLHDLGVNALEAGQEQSEAFVYFVFEAAVDVAAFAQPALGVVVLQELLYVWEQSAENPTLREDILKYLQSYDFNIQILNPEPSGAEALESRKTLLRLFFEMLRMTVDHRDSHSYGRVRARLMSTILPERFPGNPASDFAAAGFMTLLAWAIQTNEQGRSLGTEMVDTLLDEGLLNSAPWNAYKLAASEMHRGENSWADWERRSDHATRAINYFALDISLVRALTAIGVRRRSLGLPSAPEASDRAIAERVLEEIGWAKEWMSARDVKLDSGPLASPTIEVSLRQLIEQVNASDRANLRTAQIDDGLKLEFIDALNARRMTDRTLLDALIATSANDSPAGEHSLAISASRKINKYNFVSTERYVPSPARMGWDLGGEIATREDTSILEWVEQSVAAVILEVDEEGLIEAVSSFVTEHGRGATLGIFDDDAAIDIFDRLPKPQTPGHQHFDIRAEGPYARWSLLLVDIGELGRVRLPDGPLAPLFADNPVEDDVDPQILVTVTETIEWVRSDASSSAIRLSLLTLT